MSFIVRFVIIIISLSSPLLSWILNSAVNRDPRECSSLGISGEKSSEIRYDFSRVHCGGTIFWGYSHTPPLPPTILSTRVIIWGSERREAYVITIGFYYVASCFRLWADRKMRWFHCDVVFFSRVRVRLCVRIFGIKRCFLYQIEWRRVLFWGAHFLKFPFLQQ